MNEIQIFNNPEFGDIRTVVIDGEPWFVGKDVAEILGYQNASKALADHVDEEDKLNNESLSSIGQRGGWLINESGLYSLVIGSKLPSARKFKRWITSEVLPAIRKTGHYEAPDRSAYDTKATSVGEVVNLVRLQQKIMERRGCTAKDISEMMDAMFRQFGIQVPEIFLAAPGTGNGTELKAPGTEAEEVFEECLEELQVSAWERGSRRMVTCTQFNDFCAQRGISARKFRKWLYQGGYIMASVNRGKANYSINVWMGLDQKPCRCVVLKN